MSDPLLPDPKPGIIVTLTLTFLARRDTLLPTWTAKTVKTLVKEEPCMEPARQVILKRQSYRPGRVTPLFQAGRPLYKTPRHNKPLILAKGEYATAEITFYTPSTDIPPSLGACQGRVPEPWDSLEYAVTMMDVVRTDYLSDNIKKNDIIKITIITPILLSTKTPIPPVTWGKKLARKLPPAHRLLPTPGYILAAAAKTYLGTLTGEQVEDSHIPWITYLRGETGIIEQTYNLKPITIQYNKKRKIRGVTGTITLKIQTKRTAQLTQKLLPTAQKLGIGRSRTIGLGIIKYQKT